jgi:hypothetical protein
MAAKAVVDAVEARLAANWSACPVVGLFGVRPDDGASFVTTQYPVANAEAITIGAPGNNVHREAGAIRFVLSVSRQLADPVAQGLQWADDLGTLFRSKVFGGIETFSPGSPAIDDRTDDGIYLVMSFVVPYRFDRFG